MIYSQIWTWLSARVRHGFGHSRRIRLVIAGGSGSNNCAQLWLGCSFILPTTLNVTWVRPSQPRKLLGPSASSREPHLSPADGSFAPLGLNFLPLRGPRLAPWAAFYRGFTAERAPHRVEHRSLPRKRLRPSAATAG